MKRIRKE